MWKLKAAKTWLLMLVFHHRNRKASQHQKPQSKALQMQPPEAWHSQPLALLLVRFWVLHLLALEQSLAQWRVLVRPPLPDWSQTPLWARSTACLGQSTRCPLTHCKTF
jgi:hypothetical protein